MDLSFLYHYDKCAEKVIGKYKKRSLGFNAYFNMKDKIHVSNAQQTNID